MKYTQGSYPIVEKRAIAEDTYSFTVKCPEIADAAVPGQFVHILPAGYSLRRPISIAGTDREKGMLRIVFAVRGKGTKALADMPAGADMDIIGPLGHGFTLFPGADNVVLVGGGIGVPPMLPLAAFYGKKAVAVSGFRSYPQIILQDDLDACGVQTICCTEDGSAGAVQGFVTQPLEQLLADGVDAVYACGPAPMLKAVAELCIRNKTYCEVSLEERMGCGIGACLVCACKTRNENGGEEFSHVCKKGPVFKAEEVVW